jgi:hypothetical protein
MSKTKKVVHISAGHADLDPEFTISVGNVPFRFRIGPNGRSNMIGPARLIEFPREDVPKKLAKSAEGSDECPDRGNHRARKTKMKIFTLENGTSSITRQMTIPEAEAVVNAESLRNEAGLAKLAADWPAARLVDIWNNLPGSTPVKKFTDRKTAVSRIWKAIQSLDGRGETQMQEIETQHGHERARRRPGS